MRQPRCGHVNSGDSLSRSTPKFARPYCVCVPARPLHTRVSWRSAGPHPISAPRSSSRRQRWASPSRAATKGEFPSATARAPWLARSNALPRRRRPRPRARCRMPGAAPSASATRTLTARPGLTVAAATRAAAPPAHSAPTISASATRSATLEPCACVARRARATHRIIARRAATAWSIQTAVRVVFARRAACCQAVARALASVQRPPHRPTAAARALAAQTERSSPACARTPADRATSATPRTMPAWTTATAPAEPPATMTSSAGTGCARRALDRSRPGHRRYRTSAPSALEIWRGGVYRIAISRPHAHPIGADIMACVKRHVALWVGVS